MKEKKRKREEIYSIAFKKKKKRRGRDGRTLLGSQQTRQGSCGPDD